MTPFLLAFIPLLVWLAGEKLSTNWYGFAFCLGGFIWIAAAARLALKGSPEAEVKLAPCHCCGRFFSTSMLLQMRMNSNPRSSPSPVCAHCWKETIYPGGRTPKGWKRFGLLFILFALVPAGRAIDTDFIVPDDLQATNQWGRAGCRQGLPNRTTIFATHAPGVSAATLQSSLDSCPSNQVVQLLDGIYALSTSIYIRNPGVTLRGTNTWPLKTILAFQNSNGNDPYIGILNPYAEGADATIHTVNWTAGYTRGTSNITVSSTTGLSVGTIAYLDQSNDNANGETGYGGEGLCGTCDVQINGLHVKQHTHQVMAISGTTVTIDPPIFDTNWNSSFSPRLLWIEGQSAKHYSGLENLWITSTNDTHTTPEALVQFRWVADCYMKRCVIHVMRSHGVKFTYALNPTIYECWFNSNKTHGSQCYAIAGFGGGGALIMANLFYPHTSGIITAGGCEGWVGAYNYFTNSQFEVVGGIASSFGMHGGHSNGHLFEGNHGLKMDADNIHGTAGHIYAFRNRLWGWQTNQTQQCKPIEVAGSNYWLNAVGNILGHPFFHLNYDDTNGASTKPIFALNFWDANTAGTDHYDVRVQETMIRRDNWNTVSAGIPSIEDIGSTNKPNSRFLSSKPACFGDLAWPPYDSHSPTLDSPTNIPPGFMLVNNVWPEDVATGGGGSPAPANAAAVGSGGMKNEAPSGRRLR